MSTTEWMARLEGVLRPALTRLPPAAAVRLYARGRRTFLRSFAGSVPSKTFAPQGFERVLWGLRFQSPIFNAAGMFKMGEGYDVVARQGAGAYLAGTTTARPREGNRRCGVAQPFAPYPTSGAASNWLGLPNPGHRRVAERLQGLERYPGCPIGASVAADPDPSLDEEQKLESLVAGMRLYDQAGIDFLEMNESCPNTEDSRAEDSNNKDSKNKDSNNKDSASAGLDETLVQRLAYVREHFLERRSRALPVVVKFSCDTEVEQVASLVDQLLDFGFDGVNFGNTSTAYPRIRPQILAAERPLYDYFVRVFAGGVSGRPLKALSLALTDAASAHLMSRDVPHEFHVWRTGGVEEAGDVIASEQAGIAISQWYSGYFESFAKHGHDLYRQLYHALELHDFGETGTVEVMTSNGD